jgi:diguanylate cyclase
MSILSQPLTRGLKQLDPAAEYGADVRTDTHQPIGLMRARRTAASARAVMALAGMVMVVAGGHSGISPQALTGDHSGISPQAAVIGFAIIFATSLVQLALPRPGWLIVEESLAPVSAVLVIGLGPEHVTSVSLLWLSTVACGVLARGGRQHWYGRLILIASLGLPIYFNRGLTWSYALLCIATVALLLTCGRITSELRAMHDRARWDADHDGLTDALSRTAFRAELDRIAGELQTAEEPVSAAVVLVDIDNFGAINKATGHAAGDSILVSLAERMRHAFGKDSIVGRLGGDEFAVIVSHRDPRELARQLLDDLATGAPGIPSLTASAGMALLPRDGDDADALLRAVDVALRVAKRSGRRQVSVYEGESFSDQGPGGARETLERLIAGVGLNVVVQPIVTVPEGVAHAFEALARFQTRGTSSPLHWFALADEFGVRDRLELACLRAALRTFQSRPPGTALTVNLSGPLLLDPRIDVLLDEVGPLEGLILEMTENSLLEDTPGMHAQISRLLGRGVRFAVDDMGAGYSGLRQITTIRPSYLKLDRSLISGIDTDPDRGALVSAMLGYARQTGGHLVAEGVETEAELETLLALGVRLVQGFYLARPGWPWPEIRSMADPRPDARPPAPLRLKPVL